MRSRAPNHGAPGRQHTMTTSRSSPRLGEGRLGEQERLVPLFTVLICDEIRSPLAPGATTRR